FDVDAGEEDHAADEEGDEGEDAEAAGPADLGDDSEEGGSDDSCGFLEDAVEAEELCGAALGDEGGEEGAAEGLGAALDDADGSGERPEVPGLLHEVAEDGDAGVGGECDVDPVLRPEPPGEAPEEEGEGDADELEGEWRAEEAPRPDPDPDPLAGGILE